MRSTRTTNGEHESSSNRRSDHHHSSSSAKVVPETTNTNGHSGGGGEYRSKRLAGGSSVSSSSSSSLIKRMKTSNSISNDVKNTSTNVASPSNIKDSRSSHRTSSQVTNNGNAVNANQSDECNQLSMLGFGLEETEALSLEDISQNAILDFEKFNKASSNFKELVGRVLQAKNPATALQDKAEKTFDNHKIEGLLYLAEIKSLNRMDKYRLRESKQQLIDAKEKVDKIHMQLQNVQYEIMHLQKEEKACASFRSRDESLELVDQNKFLLSSDLPEDLKHLVVHSQNGQTLDSNASSEDKHKLRLAQLNWELKQRVAYESNLKSSQEKSEQLSLEITSKRKILSRFNPTLQAIVEASKPLVSELNVPLQVHNTYHAMTPHLAEPLYALYVQLYAYKSASGSNYHISILGTLEDALEFKAKLRAENNKSKRLNEDDDEERPNGDDEDEERRSARKKKSRFNSISHQKDSKTESSLQNISDSSLDLASSRYEKVLLTNPIKVKVVFHHRGYKLNCQFTYFHRLEMIGLDYKLETVSYSAASSPFSVTDFESNLFSKLLNARDTGLTPPNAAVAHILGKHDIDSYQELFPHIGYTYEWTQRIGGLHFLSPDEKPVAFGDGRVRVKTSVAINSIEETIKAIYLRLQARITLQEQINEIYIKKRVDTSKFENLLGDNIQDGASLEPNSHLKLFDRISLEQFLAEMDKQASRKAELVNFFGSDGGQSLLDIFDENNFFFRLEVEIAFTIKEREEDVAKSRNYTLTSLIIIPHNFPTKWPFFLLSMANHPHDSLPAYYLEPIWLRSLEEHVNVHLPVRVMNQSKQLDKHFNVMILFLRQIYDIQCGLDVIIDARRKLMLKENRSLQVYSGPLCVNHNLALSIVEGRDHSLRYA